MKHDTAQPSRYTRHIRLTVLIVSVAAIALAMGWLLGHRTSNERPNSEVMTRAPTSVKPARERNVIRYEADAPHWGQ